ncbi:MAG: polyprenyl synthetase family protein [Tissierellaceae bacterium]
MDFKEELENIKVIIDKELKDILKHKDLHQRKVLDAIEYSLFTGGKRLRPILAIKSYEIFGKDTSEIMPFALGIEMIHTYSLIHDDLPAMDNDSYRRGKLTNHVVFGDAIAILAGDGLLNLSYEVMSDFIYENAKNLNDYEKYNKAIREIGKYSGIYGMIGGQVVDLTVNLLDITEEKLLFMYRAKTAALIQSALVAGAIIGEAMDEEIELMRDFGLNLGMAYQIRDDILDIHKDSNAEKVTYLTFFDEISAKYAVEEYSNAAMENLNKLSKRDTSFFKNLTKKLMGRNR